MSDECCVWTAFSDVMDRDFHVRTAFSDVMDHDFHARTAFSDVMNRDFHARTAFSDTTGGDSRKVLPVLRRAARCGENRASPLCRTRASIKRTKR